MGAFVLHRLLHSMLTCSWFPAVFLFWAENRCLLRHVSVRYASAFVLFCWICSQLSFLFWECQPQFYYRNPGMVLTPPPYLRALEIENRRTAPELQQHNIELFSSQIIT